MSAYSFNVDNITKLLIPPKLRQLKHIAWLKVITNPLKWLHNDFFNEYCGYTTPFYDAWVSTSTYNIDDRIYWTNYRGYVCIKNSCLNIEPTGNAQSADYWLEFTPDYVAVDERVYFRPQKIFFVKALNDHFKPGPLKIYLASNSNTIYYPLFYYDLLGATNTERDKAIFDFASKYLPAGFTSADFTIITY
jgi:hypothetical protein